MLEKRERRSLEPRLPKTKHNNNKIITTLEATIITIMTLETKKTKRRVARTTVRITELTLLISIIKTVIELAKMIEILLISTTINIFKKIRNDGICQQAHTKPTNDT